MVLVVVLVRVVALSSHGRVLSARGRDTHTDADKTAVRSGLSGAHVARTKVSSGPDTVRTPKQTNRGTAKHTLYGTILPCVVLVLFWYCSGVVPISG